MTKVAVLAGYSWIQGGTDNECAVDIQPIALHYGLEKAKRLQGEKNLSRIAIATDHLGGFEKAQDLLDPAQRTIAKNLWRKVFGFRLNMLRAALLEQFLPIVDEYGFQPKDIELLPRDLIVGTIQDKDLIALDTHAWKRNGREEPPKPPTLSSNRQNASAALKERHASLKPEEIAAFMLRFLAKGMNEVHAFWQYHHVSLDTSRINCRSVMQGAELACEVLRVRQRLEQTFIMPRVHNLKIEIEHATFQQNGTDLDMQQDQTIIADDPTRLRYPL